MGERALKFYRGGGEGGAVLMRGMYRKSERMMEPDWA